MDEDEFEGVRKDDIDNAENISNDTADKTEHGLTHGELTDPNGFAEDFLCSVCLRIAVQPTTLICGHTSCRICLARWFFSSQKKECPMCRQPYQGHPKINAHIRNMISKLYPKEVIGREQEISQNEDDMKTLKKYDDALAKGGISNGNSGNAFCLGVGITICVFIIAHLAWYWQSSEKQLLVMKPVQMWKPQDVATWLKDLSWASVYANESLNNNIDGNMLLAMDNKSVEHLLNITDSLHQRALILAIEVLRERKVKMPSTLWEYKALFPGRCLFLIHGLNEFPRATFLYLWLYFYEDMFLPFVKTSTESGDEIVDVSTSLTLADRISTLQWVYFLFSVAVFPQWLVIVLAYQMFSYHLITPLFVISMAILNQILEILDVVYVYRNNLQNWNFFQVFKNYVWQLLHTFMFMVVWPVIPRFICDVLFYSALYLRPIRTFGEVHRKLMEHINLH